MIYLLLMLYSNILVMGNDFVIVSIYWIVVHTVFKQCFWWPVYKGKKIAVYNFVAPGILSPTWWFLHPRPWNEMKKISNPEWSVSCSFPAPCTLPTFATVLTATLLCLPYLLCDCVGPSHSAIPYPLYDHISLHHMCLCLCVWPEVGVVMAKKLWPKLRSFNW